MLIFCETNEQLRGSPGQSLSSTTNTNTTTSSSTSPPPSTSTSLGSRLNSSSGSSLGILILTIGRGSLLLLFYLLWLSSLFISQQYISIRRMAMYTRIYIHIYRCIDVCMYACIEQGEE